MRENDSSSGTNSPLNTYLKRTGAVGLICKIEPNGTQFSRLVEQLDISRSTVSNRLEEGEELGLFERMEITGRGTSHAYVLTEAGAKIRLHFDQCGLSEKHRIIAQLQRQYEAQLDEIRARIAEDESQYEPPIEGETFRQMLSTYHGSPD